MLKFYKVEFILPHGGHWGAIHAIHVAAEDEVQAAQLGAKHCKSCYNQCPSVYDITPMHNMVDYAKLQGKGSISVWNNAAIKTVKL